MAVSTRGSTARSMAAAVGVSALIVVALAGCGQAAAGLSDDATGVASSSAATVQSPPAATVPASPARSEYAAVCDSLLQIDAVPVPDTGPAAGAGPTPPTDSGRAAPVNADVDAAAYREYGSAVRPHLTAAIEAAPADLAAALNRLAPTIEAAESGQPLPEGDEITFTAVAAYEGWAHANCGYQTVDLMAYDYEFDGAPITLAAGPTSISLMNHSEKGEFHTAVLGRLQPGADVSLRQLVDLPFDQVARYLDLEPGIAFAAPGTTGGVLVNLQPGRYFLICPIETDLGEPTTAHLYKGMLAEFDVV